MTGKAIQGSISYALTERQPYSEVQIVDRLFAPLLRKKAVALHVRNGEFLSRNKQSDKLLFLSSATMFGGSDTYLAVGLQGNKFEILNTSTDLKMINFVKIGLKPTLAKALANALNHVFNGEHYGNSGS